MTSLVSFTIPEGCSSGDTITLNVNGSSINVEIPQGNESGDTLQISIPSTETNEEDGPYYTSGEDDNSGPAILSPLQFQQRHPNASHFRTLTRPYRVHYFHNQKDGNLQQDTNFIETINSSIEISNQVPRITYSEVIQTETSFHPYSLGTGNIGNPVMLTHIPNNDTMLSTFSPKQMCLPHDVDPNSDTFLTAVKDIQATSIPQENDSTNETDKDNHLGNVSFRVCLKFEWGQRKISGRLPLIYYFHMLMKHHKADVPFYIFENSIGGYKHTLKNYQTVDNWVGQNNTNNDQDTTNRERVANQYTIPSLFQNCCLQVPFELRPRSTDGVLLIGSQRTGSYPHYDPTYTAAWNYLTHGKKRWVLFPPNISRETIVGKAAAQVDPKTNLDDIPRGTAEFYNALATKGAGYVS